MIVFEQLSIYSTYQLHDEEGMLGLIDSAEINIGTWIRNGWFVKWWKSWKLQFPPEFQSYIEDMIHRVQHDGDI
jgi:hypothetical protein